MSKRDGLFFPERLLALLAGVRGAAGVAGAGAAELHCRTYIELDRTGVVLRGRQIANDQIPSDQIKRGEIDTDADRGLPGLHVHQRWHGDPHAPGPGGERLAPAQARHGEVGSVREAVADPRVHGLIRECLEDLIACLWISIATVTPVLPCRSLCERFPPPPEYASPHEVRAVSA